MSQFKQSKAGKPVSKVVPLIAMPPDGWEQRTGWKQEGAFGFMACVAAPNDRVVRLADVLRWIQTGQALPRAEALQVLIASLPDDVMTWLYRLDHVGGGRAAVVPGDAMFGYSTAKQIDADKEKYRQDRAQAEHEAGSGAGWSFERRGGGSAPKPAQRTFPEPTEPGRSALVKRMNEHWAGMKRNHAATCDVLDDPRTPYLTFLAVPVHKAFAVWGWGSMPAVEAVDSTPAELTDWPSLVAYRKANPKADWGEGRQREILRAELAKRGDTSKAKEAMAKELYGPTSTRQAIDGVLRRDRMRDRKRAKASALPTLVVLSTGAGRKKAG